tara:strand:+ start:230 stop:487 length:258 start_codon:yes stop_codon:yes gene_type:complete
MTKLVGIIIVLTTLAGCESRDLFKDGGMEDFYDIFCEVEFLCSHSGYQSEPNWLGWMIIVMLGFVLLVIIVKALEAFDTFDPFKK